MLGSNRERRSVIVHYHLFKNGGTSVERLLKSCYGERWETFDKDDPGSRISALEMQRFIESRHELKAVSSHQLVPPLIDCDFHVMPLIFLRHPIVRVRSAYLFEWQKQLGLSKPKGSLAEYINEKFKNRAFSVISNFQVSRLSNQNYCDGKPVMGCSDAELLFESKALIDNLPAFGLVEQFSDSLHLICRAANEDFPELVPTEYRENVLQPDVHSTDSCLAHMKEDMGAELFTELCQRNSLDLQLYSYAEGRFNHMRESISELSTVNPFHRQLNIVN